MDADPKVQKKQKQAALAILLRVIERQPLGSRMDADKIRSWLRPAQAEIVNQFPPIMGNAIRLAKKAKIVSQVSFTLAARKASHGRLMQVWERA